MVQIDGKLNEKGNGCTKMRKGMLEPLHSNASIIIYCGHAYPISFIILAKRKFYSFPNKHHVWNSSIIKNKDHAWLIWFLFVYYFYLLIVFDFDNYLYNAIHIYGYYNLTR